MKERRSRADKSVFGTEGSTVEGGRSRGGGVKVERDRNTLSERNRGTRDLPRLETFKMTKIENTGEVRNEGIGRVLSHLRLREEREVNVREST